MITGDFVNGLHLMVGKNSDMDNGSPKVTETSENTFFLNWESGDIFVFSEGEWAAADSAVAGIVAALLNKGALPAVTSADNGKVLGVDDGVWTPVEGGGGGGSGMEKFQCTFTLSGSTISCNKTFAEITAARTAGKYVEGVYGDNICPLVALNASTATFQMLVQNSGVSFNVIYLTSTDTCIPDTVPIAPGVVTDNSSTPSIAAAANTIYKFGEISSLTISSFPATGDFTVIFTSGATATTFTEPAGMILPDGFSIEANTRYEINVSDGYAVVASWAVSA